MLSPSRISKRAYIWDLKEKIYKLGNRREIKPDKIESWAYCRDLRQLTNFYNKLLSYSRSELIKENLVERNFKEKLIKFM